MPTIPPFVVDRPLVIAGPCVIESLDLCRRVAEHVGGICRRLSLPYVFKASFDKANRSAGSSFRGPGLDAGVKILATISAEFGVPVLTDIHEPEQAAVAASAGIDVLQVPAFLARQTDLLAAVGATGKTVNVKKGQFMSPPEMQNAIDKIRFGGSAGPVWLTERGTFFGYNRLVNDFTGLPVMRAMGCPVIFDVTHSTQMPAGLGNASGGNPQYAPMLARAAIAAGVDGLFVECHPSPREAKSDAATMLGLDAMEPLLRSCVQIAAIRGGW